MKMLAKTGAVFFAVLLFVTTASAQFVDDATQKDYQKENSLGVKPAVNPFSLIDFSRIRWSNSYSVSFFSGGNSSGSLGLWNSRMSYDLSNSLSLAFDINLVHNPSGLIGKGTSDAMVLPGFSLDFHPSRNFRMRFDYQTLDYRSDYMFRRGSWY